MGQILNMMILSVCLSFSISLLGPMNAGYGNTFYNSYTNVTLYLSNNTTTNFDITQNQMDFVSIILNNFISLVTVIVGFGIWGVIGGGLIAIGIYLTGAGSEFASKTMQFLILWFVGSVVIGPTYTLLNATNQIIPYPWNTLVVVIFNLMWLAAIISYLNGADT